MQTGRGTAFSARQAGWIKPQRTRTLAELQQLIEHRRTELRALEQEACALPTEMLPAAQ